MKIFGVEKNSCYAAAVAALALSNESASVSSHHKHTQKLFLSRTDSAESRGGYHQINASGPDVNMSWG